VQMRKAIDHDQGVVIDIDSDPIFPDNEKEPEQKPDLGEPSDNDGIVS